jgi:acyl-coenzyme A synthetase/AMP-(fatty) acid ligase
MLDALPENFEKPSNLSVMSLGAPLSEALRDRAMARLATFVCNWYGSNEVGLVSCISSRGSGGIGTMLPVARVEVVDERGVPVPPGQLGRLRIRTPSMHTEYFGDPEATSRVFRDGWFHSSDLAIRHGSNRLQIVARSDEVLNIGGTKVPPSAVEEMVLRVTHAKDAGAFSLPNDEGVEEIWIAVAEAKADDKELRERIERGLRPLQFAAFHVVRLPQIPRNPGGKIQRDLLKRAVAEASNSPAGRSS